MQFYGVAAHLHCPVGRELGPVAVCPHDGDAVSELTISAEVVPYVDADEEDHIGQQPIVVDVPEESQAPADGSGVLRAAGGHYSVVDAVGKVDDPPGLGAQYPGYVGSVLADVPDGLYPEREEFLRSPGAYGVYLADVAAFHKLHELLGGQYLEVAVGLHLLAAGLGGNHVVSQTDGASHAQFLQDAALYLMGEPPGLVNAPCGFGDVQISFVEHHRLHYVGVLGPQPMEFLGDRPVLLHVAANEFGGGADAPGLGEGHPGMQSHLPCGVVAGADDLDLVRRRQDGDRPAFEGGIVPHLNRGVIAVHVDVDDDAVQTKPPVIRWESDDGFGYKIGFIRERHFLGSYGTDGCLPPVQP